MPKLLPLPLFRPFYFPFSRRCELSPPADATCLGPRRCQTAELYEYRIGPLWQDKLCRKLRTPPSVFATVITCDQIFMRLSPSLLHAGPFIAMLLSLSLFLLNRVRGLPRCCLCVIQIKGERCTYFARWSFCLFSHGFRFKSSSKSG